MGTQQVPAPTPPAEVRLADRLATPRRPPPAKARATAVAALHEIAALDLAIYRAVAETPSPTLDPPMRRLSDAANLHTRALHGVKAKKESTRGWGGNGGRFSAASYSTAAR